MKTIIALLIISQSVNAQSLKYSKAELKELSCIVAQQYKIDCALFAAIITQESNWKVNAVNKRSSDYGLTQINSRTIKAYGFDKARLLSDPLYSLHAGAKVLKYFSDRYKHKETKWWTRYNCGTSKTKGASCLAYYKKVQRHLQPVYLSPWLIQVAQQ